MTVAYNLGALYDAQVGGDRPALIDLLDWENPREYSHREIDELVSAVARGLLKRGLVRGDAVAILSANRAEYVIAFLGIARAGLVAVPISHKLPRPTVEYVLADASAKHVMCDAPRRGLVPAGLPATSFDAADSQGFGALLDRGPFEAVVPSPQETAMVLYTSGSTGRPKGVPLSHEGHLWVVRTRLKRGAPFTAQRLLVAAPLCHMNGLCTTLFVMAAGASEVLMPEFDARRFLQAIERFRCTWLTGVPPMYAMCLREKDLVENTDRSTVATIRLGSAPISPKLWREIKAAFPGALLMNSYGTTEAGPVICGPRPDRELPEVSIGWPFEDVELRLVDAHGRDADEGVLWQRTPANMSGYLNLPDKTREVLTADGWYISGDIFRCDADGAYFFVGRADDMFVCGGENIFPGEVERLLEQHPQIAQACVVSVPDDIKGEMPFAFVVRQAGAALSEDEVKRYALEQGPAYQHPRRVCMLDALPLAGPNKVDRKALKQRALELWQAAESRRSPSLGPRRSRTEGNLPRFPSVTSFPSITPRLALDHCACIVNDLAAGAARWERLGFNLAPESRQRGAVPGRDGAHPWATANRCAILGRTYLELVGVVDPAAYNPWARFVAKNEGLHILAMRCDDAESAYAALSARTEALLPPVPRERILDVDGEPRTMRFRNISSRDEHWPEARYIVIEHQTPGYLWQPRYQQHENGACELVAVTFVANDPSALIPRMQALGAEVVVHDAGGFTAKLPGRGAVHAMRSDSYANTYGHTAHSGMHAMTVSFRDLGRTLDSLEKRGVSIGRSPRGHWIGPGDANGFVMHLVQDSGRS